MSITFTQYSEYELVSQSFKVGSAQAFTSMECVGTSEEELDVKEITKQCRGVVVKRVVKGAGTGKLTQSLHMPIAIYESMYGLDQSGLQSGVKAYGQPSVHKEFILVQKVKDEDGNVKYKAYPRAILESGPKRSITNGAEEVAEISLEYSLLPDTYGNCMYEAYEDDLSSELKAAWMTSWSAASMQASA